MKEETEQTLTLIKEILELKPECRVGQLIEVAAYESMTDIDTYHLGDGHLLFGLQQVKLKIDKDDKKMEER